MLNQRTAEVAQQLKPLRLNFAGFCYWCETKNCVKPRCLALHAESVWAVCSDCGGSRARLDDEYAVCTCWGGVMHMANVPASQTAQTAVSADAPVSAPPATLSAPLPRCLGCGHRTAVAHPNCWDNISNYWTPCAHCFGRRVGHDGCECQTCDGVGFIDIAATDTLAERADDVRPW